MARTAAGERRFEWDIRAADPAVWGGGHRARCEVLAAAVSRLTDDAASVRPFSYAPRSRESEGGGLPGILVIDQYDLDPGRLARLLAGGDCTVYVQDAMDEPVGFDVLLHQGPTPVAAVQCAGPRRLSGTEYLLVDPAFAAVSSTGPDISSVVGRDGETPVVLIAFGLVDSKDCTGRVLRAISRVRDVLPSCRMVVAMGAAAPHLDQVRTLARDIPDCTVHVGRPTLLPLLEAADIAIGGGGVGLWERLAAGVPSLCLAQTEAQGISIDALAAVGTVIPLGNIADQQDQSFDDALGAALRDLLTGREKRQQLFRRSRRTVDGFGAERTVHALRAAAVSAARLTGVARA